MGGHACCCHGIGPCADMSKAPEMYVPEAFTLILIRSMPRGGFTLLPLVFCFFFQAAWMVRRPPRAWITLAMVWKLGLPSLLRLL